MSDTTTPSWLNSINDLATSPLFNGLLGMTQGFAQAAMPTRMPTPFGAVLGMGAAGLGSGVQGAFKSQLAEQQAKAARLNNQLLEAGLPFRKDLLGSLGAAAAGGGDATGGGMTGGGSGVAIPGGVPGSAATSPYLVDPAFQKKLALYALATGQDRSSAAFLSGLQSLAGGPGYGLSPQGTAFPVPGGPHDPSVISRNTYAEKIPAANTNLWEKWNTPGEQPGGGYGTPQQLLGAPPQVGSGSSGAVPPDPFPQIAARINGVENGTGNPAAANPASSAVGNGQFLAGTWPSVLRATRPDLASGRSDADLLALRSNPELSLSATDAYARQNGAALAQAGFPVTPGTVYMAHGLGPGGAMAVLRATPQTPVAAVLPQNVIAANPYLQGKTAGDVRQYFDQKMQGIGGGQPASIAPGITQHRTPTGGVVTTNTLPAQIKMFETDMNDLKEATTNANAVQANMMRLYEQKDLVNKMPQMGAAGTERANIANFVQTFIKPIPGIGAAADSFLHSVGDLPDAEAAQQFTKLATQAAGLQEKNAVGMRGGLGLTKLFLQANPGMNTIQGAARDMTNFLLVQHQAELDYLRGLHDHVTSNGQALTNGQSNYVPAADFDKKWANQDNAKVYLAATQAMNGKNFADWTKLIGTDPKKISAALDVVRRVDPNAQILWEDNKPHNFAQGGG